MPSAPIKVLYVEDNPVDAMLVTSRLGRDRGFEFTRVEQLRDAVGRLETDRFDVVLLDLMLPDASGLRAVGHLHEQAADLPIVVLTGFGAEDLDLACEAVRGGAQEFLHKGATDAPRLARALQLAIARKAQENARIRNARHEQLTGLANRGLLEERFERACARAERSGRAVALLVVEIDRFADLVAEHGPDVGDRLLKAQAERLGARLRRSDTLARLRRRGFTALIEGLGRPGDLARLGRRLLAAVAEPLEIGGRPLRVTASIGAASWRQGTGLGELLRAAERAMFQAAAEGGNCLLDGGPGVVPGALPPPAALPAAAPSPLALS